MGLSLEGNDGPDARYLLAVSAHPALKRLRNKQALDRGSTFSI
jgi:hypothetical protein